MVLITASLFALLAIKHFLFDFPFQTQEEITHKGTFGDMRGVAHSLKHGMGTLVVFVLYVSTMVGLFVVFDFVTHYLIDWSKVKLSKGLTPADKKFWVLLGADQLLHTFVYITMVVFYFYIRKNGLGEWHQ